MTAISISILLSLYLIPSFVALFRHHHNISGVVIVNVLTGWTLVGWIAALVMACLRDPQPITPPALYNTETGERLTR